ncbi:NADP-dependent glyceraldehyde-3-phosphate dehydrogenase, partial [Bacillus cereus]
MTTSTTYKFYLNGEWRESTSGETIEISSPYSHEVMGQVQAITRREVDEA